MTGHSNGHPDNNHLQPQASQSPQDDATRFLSNEFDEGADAQEFELFEKAGETSNGPIGVIGDYLLLEQIGAGGMGRVYRAEHRTMNREVALKVLSPDIATQAGLIQQFFSEIRAVAKLMHPNIVTAFDAGSIAGQHYLVMELVEGEVLADRVRRLGPLSSGEAANVIEQVGLALSYAHRLGVVHRDIKPSNIMLTTNGTVKVLDFGLAMLGKRAEGRANRKVFMGTPEYMSPEQIENADLVDGRSDLYSLGATLYYLLTGEPMFRGNKMHVAVAQLRQQPEPLYVVRGDVDLRLDSIFQKLVEKAPARRYASAEELLESLAQLNLSTSLVRPVLFQRGVGRLGSELPTSGVLSQSTVAKKSQVVAIDLGMLVSTVAYFDPVTGPQIIPQGDGNTQHLRNMLWSAGKQIKIGGDANTLRQTHPEQVIHSLQRWIGQREVNWLFAGERTPPEVLLAGVLKQLMWNAARATDGSDHAIVTVPSCYDQMHRRAIRNACRIAGLNLVQLLDKPLAAGLAWVDVNSRLTTLSGSTSAVHSKLLFVHLGGTGLEVSVLQASGLEVKQLGVCGSWKHGSLRWQSLLTEYFVTRLREQTGKAIKEDVVAAARLQRTMELAMDRLTRSSRVEVKFEWEGAAIEQTITQEGLVKIAPELCKAIEDAIRVACVNANIEIGEIDNILLAGSMLKMRPVQQIVKNCVPHRVALTELEKADFARGAALQARHFSSLTQLKSSHPYGVGCSAYDIALLAADSNSGKSVPRVLLERSSVLPTTQTRTLRPTSLGNKQAAQAFAPLQIIESSGLNATTWLALGKVKPDELFPQRSGSQPLQLRLEIDENGILESSLAWPDGNRRVRLPHSSDPTLSEADIQRWQKWLDTTFLCRGC